ncbi:MAG: nuclear transport factor 2 family protein [Actinomycetota bacterium]|nr:nuclear transport factor 2 family protein [Actinomycetota bacterium]
MHREDVRGLIARHDAAWNAQDLDMIMACYTPDIMFTNYNAGESASGAAAVREHLAAIFAGWPDLSFSGRRLNVCDEFAVSEWTATATHADGRRLEWDGVDVFPIVDGLIARKDVYTTAHAARVLS